MGKLEGLVKTALSTVPGTLTFLFYKLAERNYHIMVENPPTDYFENLGAAASTAFSLVGCAFFAGATSYLLVSGLYNLIKKS